jgi:hypothetical protein
MGKTYRWLAFLVVAALGPVAGAQIPLDSYGGGPGGTTPPGMPAPGTGVPYTSVRGPIELSPWIQGEQPGCCGPVGDHNPLRFELYTRSGWSFPIGDGQLEDSIDSGWMIQGGARALFFDDAGNAAWTVDLGLTNIYNYGGDDPPTVILRNVPNPLVQSGQVVDPTIPPIIGVAPVQVKHLNRTFVNLGGGREWYLYGSAVDTRDGTGAVWRVGLDAGGRWGTNKAQITFLGHLTDTIAGVYAAAHSDMDIPCGCCVFQVGLRLEWDYTWSDVLQVQNKSDVESLNLLFNVGVRY